jgi:inner membrane protein
MSPVTHFLTGWVLANCADFGRRDRALVALACVVPDLDGLGIIPELVTRHSAHPLLWFSQYHHSLHNLGFALLVTLAAFFLGKRNWTTAFFVFFSFHLHLFEDVLGSRGPDGDQWPIPYLMPFTSKAQWMWHGQWELNAWPNIAITLGLVLAAIYLAWGRGFSPLEMVSQRADLAFVQALRTRFPRRQEP